MTERRPSPTPPSPAQSLLIPWRLLLGWPGPLWVFPAAGVLMAMGTLAVTRSLLAFAYPTWSAVSGAWHESLWFTGAAAAAGAAGLGANLFPRNSPVTAALRTRVGPMLFAQHGLALALWLTLGHALGLVPAELAAVRGASGGALAWQDVIAGIAGLTVLTLLGFCAGAAVKHWAIGPVVAVLAFALGGLTNLGLFRPLALLLPVQQFVGSPRFALNPPTSVYRLITAVALCAVAAAWAHWACSRGTVRRSGPQLVMWLSAAAVLTAVAFAWRPEFYVVARPVHQVCQPVDGTGTVCLHRANAPAMEDVVAVVSSLRQAGLRPILIRVTDRDILDRDDLQPGEAILRIDPAPQNRRMAASDITDQVALTVSETLRTDCLLREDNFVSTDIAGALQQRILVLAGFTGLAQLAPTSDEAAITAFGRMGSADVSRFVAAHRSAIQTCRLSPGDLRS